MQDVLHADDFPVLASPMAVDLFSGCILVSQRALSGGGRPPDVSSWFTSVSVLGDREHAVLGAVGGAAAARAVSPVGLTLERSGGDQPPTALQDVFSRCPTRKNGRSERLGSTNIS